MKQTLKENGGLPASILWTLAIVAGISVANLYYNQPLLNMIRHDLGVSEFKTNLIAMVTQIGYALGLLFIIPLGDLYQRKKIIVTNFAILIVSLLTIALAPNIHIILIASFLTGICSVIPQIFVPIASQFSKPENKGRNVGIVISGLLTGILASRVISGFIGEVFGWREMYHIAAALMLICGIVVMKVLPDIRPTFKGKYSDLMKSLFLLLKEYPLLRIYSIRGDTGIRFISRHVVVSGIQDGTSPFLCRKQCHRHVRTLWNSRCTLCLRSREVCQESGSSPVQLHRLRVDTLCLVPAFCRRKHLFRYCSRHHHYRHRHAMYPVK